MPALRKFTKLKQHCALALQAVFHCAQGSALALPVTPEFNTMNTQGKSAKERSATLDEQQGWAALAQQLCGFWEQTCSVSPLYFCQACFCLLHPDLRTQVGSCHYLSCIDLPSLGDPSSTSSFQFLMLETVPKDNDLQYILEGIDTIL